MIRGNQENYILRFHHAEAPEWYYSTRQWAFTRWNYEQLDQRSIETGTNLLPEFIELAQQLTREAGYSALSYIPDFIWEQAGSLFSADYEKKYPSLAPDNLVTQKRNLP